MAARTQIAKAEKPADTGAAPEVAVLETTMTVRAIVVARIVPVGAALVIGGATVIGSVVTEGTGVGTTTVPLTTTVGGAVGTITTTPSFGPGFNACAINAGTSDNNNIDTDSTFILWSRGKVRYLCYGLFLA